MAACRSRMLVPASKLRGEGVPHYLRRQAAGELLQETGGVAEAVPSRARLRRPSRAPLTALLTYPGEGRSPFRLFFCPVTGHPGVGETTDSRHHGAGS
jgi:hypothetical protein